MTQENPLDDNGHCENCARLQRKVEKLRRKAADVERALHERIQAPTEEQGKLSPLTPAEAVTAFVSILTTLNPMMIGEGMPKEQLAAVLMNFCDEFKLGEVTPFYGHKLVQYQQEREAEAAALEDELQGGIIEP